MKPENSIEQRSSFDFVRYANCWEDAAVLVKALDTGPKRTYLSIASAGDNSLALLTLEPARVVAIDLSRVQLACLELRKAAIERMDYETVLWFLGYTNEKTPERRLDAYGRLRAFCSQPTRFYWDGHPRDIESGIICHGKFERYFTLFRKFLLPLVHGKKKIDELLAEKDGPAREAFYRTRWDNFRWRILFRVFFSRFVMGKAGRDPEFFRYVTGNVPQRILQRARHALTALPTHDNPYLRFILTGSFGTALPYYLKKEHFAGVKKNIGLLEIFHGTTGDALAAYENMFDGFNLSDIFEYMDEKLFRRTAEELIRRGSKRARFAYWNMLVPRNVAEAFPDRVRGIGDLASALFAQDRAFFYQAFHVDEVMG
jgi:S-adenosylmethionine-diacylglycerol 3-amino-3-carboxypropyl transferase